MDTRPLMLPFPKRHRCVYVISIENDIHYETMLSCYTNDKEMLGYALYWATVKDNPRRIAAAINAGASIKQLYTMNGTYMEDIHKLAFDAKAINSMEALRKHANT
jgi:hypothetical protein